MKYCKSCKKVYKNTFKLCKDDHEELVSVPEDIELKCGRCGCVEKEKLAYLHPDFFLDSGYRLKGEYHCKKCHDMIKQEALESSESKYLVVDSDGEEPKLFDDSYDAEEYVKEALEDYESDGGNEEEIKSIIVLKIYPLKRNQELTTELFASGNTNMIFYDYEWYRVKSATYPTCNYDREISVDL